MSDYVVEVRNLVKHFIQGQGLIPTIVGKTPQRIKAVDGVNLTFNFREVVGVAGESGCGKTTLGKTILKLVEPNEGKILYKGKDITNLSQKEMRPLREEMQIIFQDPYESLNPKTNVLNTVSEPLTVNGLVNNLGEKEEKVVEALELAGLKPAEEYLPKYPHNLSGGERQRVVIASVLVLEPDFIVADEPTSMLDVSVQANLLKLLKKLKDELGVTLLFITHDLALTPSFVDRLAVMYLGKVIEIGPVNQVIDSPLHPYTKALISVVPSTNLHEERDPIILSGETPDPVNVPSGCRFHPRCPQKEKICKQQEPDIHSVKEDHSTACHKVVPSGGLSHR